MASGRMEFHADSIMQHTNFSFVIPNDFIIEEIKNPRHYDRPTKSLILPAARTDRNRHRLALRRRGPGDGQAV